MGGAGGFFAGGGSGGAGGGSDNERERIARELRRRAEEAEPQITRDLLEITERAGGELFGLEDRFKSHEGITEKIGRQRTKYSLDSDEEAAETILDVLRYIFMSDDEDHASRVETVLEELKARRYEWDEELEPENGWVRGQPYKGINMNPIKDGYVFELQFHTPESVRAAKENHPLYEEARREDTPEDRREELRERMVERSDRVPFPPDIERIGVMRDRG